MALKHGQDVIKPPRREGRDKEFVVLNSHDYGTRLFCSTSMRHASRPSATEEGGRACTTDRVLNTFAVLVVPVGDKGTCCKTVWLNWLNLCTGDSQIENYINADGFWPGLFQRLEAFDFASHHATALAKL